MKIYISKIYIIVFFLCSTFAAFADPGSTNDTGNLEGADTTAAPIDDYIWLLALIALVFVFFKMKDIQNIIAAI